MSVLSRRALEASPLADLHTIASELGLDGYRRLRKDDLVVAIIERQGGDPTAEEPEADAPDAEAPDAEAPAAESRSRRTSSRGGRGGRGRTADADGDAEERPARSRRPRGDDDGERPARAPRSRRPRDDDDEAGERPARSRRGADREDREEDREERVVTGTVEVLANGSGFVRTAAEPGDDDVYVSAAQVRRCELVTGDKVTGPVRRPRRSERYASLIRVDTINDTPADEVADGTPWDGLPAAFPTTLIAFTAKDPVLKQIADLAPIGRGSRVVVAGASGSGRTLTVRALAVELAAQEGVEVHVVLAGARPEERAEWAGAELEPAAIAGLAAGGDAQAQAAERVVDAARRVVARGGHAAVVIDALDQLPVAAARRLLASARNVPDAGSLTIVAAAREPLGGETTVLTLDGAATAAERHPVLDAARSHTLRVEALVGARKATTISKNREKALAPKA